MNGVYLLIATFFIIAVILVTVVLFMLKKHQYKKIRTEVERLDKEKNLIESTPVYSELSKIESLVKNDKMEEKYDNWQKRFDIIKNQKISNINDLINDLDITTNMKDYKNVNEKIAKVEMEVYKARESANKLLQEIREITDSDEKYRGLITKLKSKYRQLINEYNVHREEYDDIGETIELQFENIEKRFLDFENSMEINEYDEVNHIIKALDTMIDHMSTVIVEVPNLVLLSKKMMPKKIEEIVSTCNDMISEGYNLDYLNLQYNMDECNKNINTILDRIKVLNLDDCMFELKTIMTYLESVFDDLDKEKLAKKLYAENVKTFDARIKKTTKIIKDIYKQLDNIRNLYDLNDDEARELDEIKLQLEAIKKDYNNLVKTEKNSKQPYTYLSKELENLSNLLTELEGHLDDSLNSIGSMQDDEVRAREQLDEIRDLLKQCKLSIRNYKLPIIMNKYFVELSEANDAINEIASELNKSPIVIETLNMRVDTARDLSLKLYKTTTDMIKTAQLAEMVIVYGNRYRSDMKEIDKGLENAEMLYHKGNYKDSLEVAIGSIELVDQDIRKKLLDVYGE